MVDNATYILTATCPSRLGTVDVITHFLYQQGCYIKDMHSFDDTACQQFFLRAAFRHDKGDAIDVEAFKSQLNERATPFNMVWQLHEPDHVPKVLIMVSKHDHCLNDLLYRYRTGHLNIEIPAIISNHPDLKGLAEWHQIPYYHFPITAATKSQQEAKVWEVIQQTQAELVVLARYMQVLSPEMCEKLNGWAINIHHSLLPGFKGAKPYHQAFAKGVKLVGATAHYVSNELDEGPIITQGVETVDHTHYPAELAEKGKDIECLTLARAVKYHCENRVFLHHNKTVVFPD
ncbi:formyltetrahydrofolate deformylase [Spartinivicinus poritis]|uniref:Formyltetrahydrofolate deformylase n=1 Tax=Spartinivicinus poritis TaxID=2994640 RepID=A0ABT5UHS8_9GAMM|nr:formyltetrahydrofolate deformylase [Spartinivicinus sp. A2-2]MDE1465937.1 formyltetrahydrofolate deformylase [Spartinivicinus sp. A2-2]